MSIVTLANLAGGLNADLSPEELGPGFWSVSWNMRFADGYASRFGGMTQAFTTPVITPYYIAPYATTTARFWIHAGLAAIYSDDGTTRTNITGASVPTGGIDDRWTGGSLNGVQVLNNGVDVPRFWAGVPATPFAVLPGWNATHRCASMRPFKNYLIALNITKGAVKFPHMVKWSNTLAPGAITAAGDWDETNPAIDAGETDLAETPDLLVDCLPLGDVNIVYKERSMYAMIYVEAPRFFRFQRLPGDYGMLSRGCAVSTPVGHVVLTAGDIVVHSGQGCTSIANAIVRDYIFSNLGQTNYPRAFVTSNPRNNEVWVCFPSGSNTACNMAAVWNWVDKTWALRTLDNVTYGATGQINFVLSNTWSAAVGTWANIKGTWADGKYSPFESRLMLAHSTPRITLADQGSTDFGANFTSVLERSGMSLDSPDMVKTCRAVYPRIEGTTGTTVDIEVGASMTASTPPTWQPARTFKIGVDQKIDTFATGRFLAIRLTHNNASKWRIRSMGLDIHQGGKY